MNKIGIYYAYWTHNWDTDFIPYVYKASKLGFDILEVNAGTLVKMSKEERTRLKETAKDAGIVLTYCIGLSKEHDVASKDEVIRSRGVTYLKKTATLIGEMGGELLSGIIYGVWPSSMPEGEKDKRPYVEASIKSIREVIKLAEDNNILFNVEAVNRFEQFIINTSDEALEYVKAVGSPNCKILLDTFHMNIEEDSIGGAIKKVGNYLGHFHIGENNRKPPGYGHIPWEEIALSLKKINYRGAIVMEPFIMKGGNIGSDIKVWRDLSIGCDIDQGAKKGLEFFRNIIQ